MRPLPLLVLALLLAGCCRVAPATLTDNPRLGRYLTERHARYLRELPTSGASRSERLHAPQADRVALTCGPLTSRRQELFYEVHFRDGRTISDSVFAGCGKLPVTRIDLTNLAKLVVETDGTERAHEYTDSDGEKLFTSMTDALRHAVMKLEPPSASPTAKPSPSQIDQSWK